METVSLAQLLRRASSQAEEMPHGSISSFRYDEQRRALA
jgi:hypothetical protein